MFGLHGHNGFSFPRMISAKDAEEMWQECVHESRLRGAETLK
jgi:hypothetical protein